MSRPRDVIALSVDGAGGAGAAGGAGKLLALPSTVGF
jgi:hypothetical protein